MIKINIVTPDWGHPLITPEGKVIRVPKSAFEPLRKLGVLERNRAQLKPSIYEFLDPQYDCLAMGLRQLLGPDLTGPAWLVCGCDECKREPQINTRMPGQKQPGIDTDKIIAEIKARRQKAA